MLITYKKLSLNQKSTYYYILCYFPIQFCVSLCIGCTGKCSGISVKGLRKFLSSEELCCLCENELNEGKEIILFGDFNKDLLNPNAHREWLVLTESLGLSQLVNQPTRVTINTSTLIDHIYSSHEDNLSKVSVCKIGISDHFAVVCNRKLNSSYKNNSHKSITYRSFKRLKKIIF